MNIKIVVVLCALWILFVASHAFGRTIEYKAPHKDIPLPVIKQEVKLWTREEVRKAVAKEFKDAPIMVKVAECESKFDKNAYNPTNGSHDGGVFQISKKYHGAQLKKLGLDAYKVEDNIKYARSLYKSSGLQPWSASKFCWSKIH